jgi:hypothetical protein
MGELKRTTSDGRVGCVVILTDGKQTSPVISLLLPIIIVVFSVAPNITASQFGPCTNM